MKMYEDLKNWIDQLDITFEEAIEQVDAVIEQQDIESWEGGVMENPDGFYALYRSVGERLKASKPARKKHEPSPCYLWIKNIAKSKGMTVAELCEKMGFRRSTIESWRYKSPKAANMIMFVVEKYGDGGLHDKTGAYNEDDDSSGGEE